MQIRACEPAPTRPCRICLSLQDDAVFADFSIGKGGGLHLVRISFDGYGCCEPGVPLPELDPWSSALLLAAGKRDDCSSPELSRALSSYFLNNKTLLWQDALLAYDLMPAAIE